MTFNVVVSCIHLASCPMSSPYFATLEATSASDCRSYIEKVMQQMHLKQNLFKVSCEEK